MKCPICSIEMPEKMKLKPNIYECQSCKLKASLAMVKSGNSLENQNESERQKALYNLRMRNYKIIIKNLMNIMTDRDKLSGLEVGCAYGWFLEACCEYSKIDCVGLEPQKEYFESIAAVPGRIKIINGFFPQDIQNKNEKFDFIVFNDVFEHIPDVDEIIKYCYASLNKNGILILNLPLSTGVFYKVSELVYKIFNNKKYLARLWQFEYVSPHLYYFTKKNLIALCQKNNFKLTKYHKIDVLAKGSVKSRVALGDTKINNFVVFLFETLLPILKFLPEDCGCFYFQK